MGGARETRGFRAVFLNFSRRSFAASTRVLAPQPRLYSLDSKDGGAPAAPVHDPWKSQGKFTAWLASVLLELFFFLFFSPFPVHSLKKGSLFALLLGMKATRFTHRYSCKTVEILSNRCFSGRRKLKVLRTTASVILQTL